MPGGAATNLRIDLRMVIQRNHITEFQTESHCEWNIHVMVLKLQKMSDKDGNLGSNS